MSEVVTGVNRAMAWKRLLGSVTNALDPELWLRTAYLLAPNRLLRRRGRAADGGTFFGIANARFRRTIGTRAWARRVRPRRRAGPRPITAPLSRSRVGGPRRMLRCS